MNMLRDIFDDYIYSFMLGIYIEMKSDFLFLKQQYHQSICTAVNGLRVRKMGHSQHVGN